MSVATALVGECTAARAPHVRGAAFAPPLTSLRLDRPCGRLAPSAAPVAGVALSVSGGTGPRDQRTRVADLTLHQPPRLDDICHMLSRVSAHVGRVRGGVRCVWCACKQAGKAPLNSETLSIGVGGVALTALLINRCPAAPLFCTRACSLRCYFRAPSPLMHSRAGPRFPSLPRRLFTDDLANAQGRTDILVLRSAACVVTLGPTNLVSTFPPRTCCLGFRV